MPQQVGADGGEHEDLNIGDEQYDVQLEECCGGENGNRHDAVASTKRRATLESVGDGAIQLAHDGTQHDGCGGSGKARGREQAVGADARTRWGQAYTCQRARAFICGRPPFNSLGLKFGAGQRGMAICP